LYLIWHFVCFLRQKGLFGQAKKKKQAVLFYYVCTAVLHILVAGLLARSQYPEGPATGQLGTGFSWFPFLKANAEMVPKTLKLQLHASYVALPT
jgi:hypothetical protein